ncbi:MAG: thrombospondin type 3 repeat-containing protein, partial [Candidatus Gracilibacteria bacterium]|nr:thrombospondin type 3 repeat-containing protein [Candidatus Gracilibacteria bacterium]
MKKFVLGFIFFFITLNAYALNESCFEYMGSSNIVQNEIFLVNSNIKLDYVKNSQGYVYNKLYKSGENELSYDIDLDSVNKGIISDGKSSTSYDYLVGTKQDYDDEMILDFKKIVGPGIIPKISIDSINYYYTISISNDNFNYLDISINNLNTFSFRFIKITFHSYNSYKLVENVKIKDLIFKEAYYTYLIKGNSGNNVFYYSNFYCSNDKDSSDFNNYTSTNKNQDSNFFYKTGLKEYNLIMKKNLVYDVKKGVDTDGDLIDDEIDNCKTYYNPNQLDSNSNGIGDICDDDDNDGIIGIYDNCPYNSNKDQKDVNNNKVGDVCEFDKDKDGIFDSFDNCISTINKDQNDDDLDGIGNSCDNCSLYNPNQLDKNNNGVGDVCEESEKFNKENDKDADS